MTFLRNLIKELKDEDTSIAADGEGSAEFTGTIDTGCYMLNAVVSGSLYGGVPNNKVTAFAGESATGKTFFVLSVVKNFLDNDKNAAVVYYDTEAAVTKNMMESRGIDVNRVMIAEPDTIQKFRHHALKVLDSYEKIPEGERPPMMMVLDSLGMLSSSKEVDDTFEGKDTKDMTKAQIIKATFRVLTLRLAKNKIPLLVTNHTYEVVGAYVPTKEIGGGSGLKYAASSIAFLSKKKDRDEVTKEIVGNVITISMYKSRLSRENKKVDVLLSYDTGLDRWWGLLDIAEKAGVFKKVAGRYELPDGSKIFGKVINESPEKYFTDEVMAKLEEYVNEAFSYGSTVEE